MGTLTLQSDDTSSTTPVTVTVTAFSGSKRRVSRKATLGFSDEMTKLLKLPHVYLGYWIDQSPKMDYKTQFRPYQLMTDGQWADAPPRR